MAEIEIGLGKTARKAYSLDRITIVPSRRTRDQRDVDIAWEIDAYKFQLPFLAEASNGFVSPESVIATGRLGGCGVLDLSGIWARYEDAEQFADELVSLPEEKAALRYRELCDAEEIKDSLVVDRIRQIKQSGVVTAGSLTPQLVQQHAKALSELDLLVIKGSVVSAEHVSKTGDPLNMKQFIREFSLPVVVGDCASYSAALHLMRTGAAGILVGSSSNHTRGVGVPQATAIADARAARMRHLDETGVYCHIIADGGMQDAADIAKAVVCGADAVMIDTEITPDTFELLRSAMATTGYETLKEFQKADIVINHPIGESE